MKHRMALLILTLSLPAQGKELPNLILLLADDLGYRDLSCYGNDRVKTPNLDRLAANGMRLTNFYAASAVCTPTRASVLTGRYPLRFDIRQHFKDRNEHLPRDSVTLPRLLKQSGYQTAHIGKWHLGGLHVDNNGKRKKDMPGPREHGFGHYQCQIEQQPLRGKMGRERLLYRKGGTVLLRDDERVRKDDPYYSKHFTDANGDFAVEMIERFHKKAKPFFLNIWWLVPHTPYEPAPVPHWEKTAASGISEDQHRFRSMVSHMDAKVGQILKKLDELGIRKNTLLVFTSDNGGAYEANIGKLKGGKTDLHEGGLKVPMIASWPGQIPNGKVSTAFGHTNDILPTFCAAAGLKLPKALKIDGMNLLLHLTKREPINWDQRGTVHWQLDIYRHLQRRGVPKPRPYSKEVTRQGRWKMLSLDCQAIGAV